MSSDKICILDIDNVLADYENFFLDWANKKYNLNEKSICTFKKKLNYKSIKYDYRTSGVKRKIPLIKNAFNFISNLHKKNFKIWIITSRPVFKNTIEDTKYWLKHNNLFYDKLFFSNNKIEVILNNVKELSQIKFIIDDDFSYIQLYIDFFKNEKVPIVFFNQPSKEHNFPNNVIVSLDFSCLERKLKL